MAVWSALDGVLARSGWIVGDAVSAADVSLFPLIVAVRDSLQNAAVSNRGKGVLHGLERLSHVASWLAAISKLDGLATGISP